MILRQPFQAATSDRHGSRPSFEAVGDRLRSAPMSPCVTLGVSTAAAKCVASRIAVPRDALFRLQAA
jgi:hypothetical protein